MTNKPTTLIIKDRGTGKLHNYFIQVQQHSIRLLYRTNCRQNCY